MAMLVEKAEACAVLWFLHLQGKSTTEVYDQMTAVYQEGVPSYDTVVEALILSSGRITIEAIVHEVRISHGSAFNTIYEELHMTNVAVHWVPQLLTPVQKQQWIDVAKKLL
ncbi:uncharacterized protein LOC111868659 [Cryptotermes secundus]|uniref:uncharacterized protein LOC111868659 n=1 Tax=Cryptotermes secundus TaxID=105785 RepID=UPI000CD7D14E|nr:uncharacterized protein LOC111868659 [Cryptotermes secundus]